MQNLNHTTQQCERLRRIQPPAALPMPNPLAYQHPQVHGPALQQPTSQGRMSSSPLPPRDNGSKQFAPESQTIIAPAVNIQQQNFYRANFIIGSDNHCTAANTSNQGLHQLVPVMPTPISDGSAPDVPVFKEQSRATPASNSQYSPAHPREVTPDTHHPQLQSGNQVESTLLYTREQVAILLARQTVKMEQWWNIKRKQVQALAAQQREEVKRVYQAGQQAADRARYLTKIAQKQEATINQLKQLIPAVNEQQTRQQPTPEIEEQYSFVIDLTEDDVEKPLETPLAVEVQQPAACPTTDSKEVSTTQVATNTPAAINTPAATNTPADINTPAATNTPAVVEDQSATPEASFVAQTRAPTNQISPPNSKKRKLSDMSWYVGSANPTLAKVQHGYKSQAEVDAAMAANRDQRFAIGQVVVGFDTRSGVPNWAYAPKTVDITGGHPHNTTVKKLKKNDGSATSTLKDTNKNKHHGKEPASKQGKKGNKPRKVAAAKPSSAKYPLVIDEDDDIGKAFDEAFNNIDAANAESSGTTYESSTTYNKDTLTSSTQDQPPLESVDEAYVRELEEAYVRELEEAFENYEDERTAASPATPQSTCPTSSANMLNVSLESAGPFVPSEQHDDPDDDDLFGDEEDTSLYFSNLEIITDPLTPGELLAQEMARAGTAKERTGTFLEDDAKDDDLGFYKTDDSGAHAQEVARAGTGEEHTDTFLEDDAKGEDLGWYETDDSGARKLSETDSEYATGRFYSQDVEYDRDGEEISEEE